MRGAPPTRLPSARAGWRRRRAGSAPPRCARRPRASGGCATRGRRGRRRGRPGSRRAAAIARARARSRPRRSPRPPARPALPAADLRQHDDDAAFRAALGELAGERERRAQVVVRRAGRQEDDVALFGELLGQVVGEAAGVGDDEVDPLVVLAQLLQALERARVDLRLDARALADGVPLDAGELLEVESASSARRPRWATPTANNRASALLPTPPFWLTKLTVVARRLSLLIMLSAQLAHTLGRIGDGQKPVRQKRRREGSTPRATPPPGTSRRSATTRPSAQRLGATSANSAPSRSVA